MKSKKHVHKESTGKQDCNGSLLTQTIFLRYQLWEGELGIIQLKQSIQLSRGCLRSEAGKDSETLGRYPGTRKEVQYPFLKVEKNKSYKRILGALSNLTRHLPTLQKGTCVLYIHPYSPVLHRIQQRGHIYSTAACCVILRHKRLAACEVNVSKEGSTSFLPKPKTAIANLSQNWVEMKRIEWVKNKFLKRHMCIVYIYIYTTFLRFLVGGWTNPSEKYESIGNLPQIWMKNKRCFELPPSSFFLANKPGIPGWVL